MSPSLPLTTETLTEAAIIATIRRLIECESPSADPGAVARSADLVAEVGAELLGTAPERIVIDGCTHLRWRFGAATRVLLLAHHDTVWPLGTIERLPYGIVDGVLRGPGSFDMKTGLAMALHAIASLEDRDGVTLLVTGDEETGSTRSRALIEETARGASAALVPEASADGGAWKAARKGVSMYEIAVQGRAAHAGLEPEKGVNATVALAHLVLLATGLGDPDAGTTVTATSASSGTTGNTVPAEARLSIDVRAWSAAELERVDRALRASASPVPGAVIEVHGGINRPPLAREMSQPLVDLARRLGAPHGLAEVAAVAVGGGSDGNFTAGAGVPTLDGVGAVGGGAHADDEHAIVAEILPRTRLLADMAAEISRTDGPWQN